MRFLLMGSPGRGLSDQGAGAPFHEGEIAVQERAGVGHMATRVGRSIRDRIPERAAEFLVREAPLIVTALSDGDGTPWASVRARLPGVVEVPDERTLILRTAYGTPPLPRGRPREGDAIGILALDPATRRRARVNGRVRRVTGGAIRVEVGQAYSNCPKYIQKRRVDVATDVGSGDSPRAGRTGSPVRSSNGGAGGAPAALDRLSPDQLRWIREADTFFVASAHPTHGADASHRGGLPGFVSATEKEISWPEYPGNMMFNTLGNLEASPRVGLAFLDFDTGATLRIAGSARIEWGDGGTRVAVAVREVIETLADLPLSFSFEEYSPHNPPVQARAR